MTIAEFEIIVETTRTAYPNAKFLADVKSKKLWFEMLRDVDYNAVSSALKEHIQTVKFPPSIAEMRAKKKVNKFTNFLPRGYDMDVLEMALLGVDVSKGRVTMSANLGGVSKPN